MSAIEVTRALEEYEALLRDRGSAVPDALAPGLSAAELDEAERDWEFRFPRDVRAVWGWRNGMGSQCGMLSLVPGHAFMPLYTALEHAEKKKDLWVARFAECGLTSAYTGRHFVTLTQESYSLFIECTDPNAENAPVFVSDKEEDIGTHPSMTVAEKICWWIWAVEHGAWIVTPEGGWDIDFDRYPKVPALKNVLD